MGGPASPQWPGRNPPQTQDFLLPGDGRNDFIRVSHDDPIRAGSHFPNDIILEVCDVEVPGQIHPHPGWQAERGQGRLSAIA